MYGPGLKVSEESTLEVHSRLTSARVGRPEGGWQWAVGNKQWVIVGSSLADWPPVHGARMPNSRKSYPVSWDQFHRDARALAWRLADKGPFEAIVCITRGGLVPAAIVA